MSKMKEIDEHIIYNEFVKLCKPLNVSKNPKETYNDRVYEAAQMLFQNNCALISQKYNIGKSDDGDNQWFDCFFDSIVNYYSEQTKMEIKMSKEKVFVLTEEYVVDNEHTVDVELFDNETKAKEKMSEVICDYLKEDTAQGNAVTTENSEYESYASYSCEEYDYYLYCQITAKEIQ